MANSKHSSNGDKEKEMRVFDSFRDPNPPRYAQEMPSFN